MNQSQWIRMTDEMWLLRNSLEISNAIERQGYRTKKNIVLVCKLWHQLGTELLFESVLLEKPDHLGSIFWIVQNRPELALWTRRITVHPFIPPQEAVSSGVSEALQVVLHYCSQVESIHLSFWFSNEHTLSFASRLPSSLRRLVWTVQSSTASLIANLLSSLKALEVLDISSIKDPESEQSAVHISVTPASEDILMPELRSLSLRGQQTDFLAVVAIWRMPKLHSLSFHFHSEATSNKLGLEILNVCAPQLRILELNTVMPWNIVAILDRCPSLERLAFNPDWPLKKLVNQPHPKIRSIGLHELWYAAEIGQGALYSKMQPIRAAAIRTSNNHNIQNITRMSFPKLERVRLLNSGLIQEISRGDGPSERTLSLWHGWMHHAETEGYRFEDCTGNVLGTNPSLDPAIETDTESEIDTGTESETSED
jgi:hypothetical protein